MFVVALHFSPLTSWTVYATGIHRFESLDKRMKIERFENVWHFNGEPCDREERDYVIGIGKLYNVGRICYTVRLVFDTARVHDKIFRCELNSLMDSNGILHYAGEQETAGVSYPRFEARNGIAVFVANNLWRASNACRAIVAEQKGSGITRTPPALMYNTITKRWGCMLSLTQEYYQRLTLQSLHWPKGCSFIVQCISENAFTAWAMRGTARDRFESINGRMLVERREGIFHFNGTPSLLTSWRSYRTDLFDQAHKFYTIQDIFDTAQVNDPIYNFEFETQGIGVVRYVGEQGGYPKFVGDGCTVEVIDGYWVASKGGVVARWPVELAGHVLYRTPARVLEESSDAHRKCYLTITEEYYTQLVYRSVHWTPERTRWHPNIRLGALKMILMKHRAAITGRLPYLNHDAMEMMLRQMTLLQLYDLGRL